MAPTTGVVLGVDFGGSKIAVALCDLDGTVLAESVIETEPGLGAVANLERATGLADGILSGADLLAVGACTFGIPLAGGVALSPAIPGWDELPLLARLEEAFGVPVTLVTDVKAAAAAEACRGALVGADPALYLNLGTGLAVAIVHEGKVMTGAHGASGEIGYNLRRAIDVSTPAGAAGAAGAAIAASHDGTGILLEDVVSGMGLASAVARLNGKPASGSGKPASSAGKPASGAAKPASGAGKPATGAATGAADVFERAIADPVYEKVLEEFLRELCYHLVNLTIAVDPERIAVGGGMVRSWEVLEPALRSALDAHVPYPPELVIGAFPYDAALRGAVDAGLELARSLAPGALR